MISFFDIMLGLALIMGGVILTVVIMAPIVSLLIRYIEWVMEKLER